MTSKTIAVPARGAAGLFCLTILFALGFVSGCGDGDDVTGGNQPPVVSVQSPQPGSVVSPVGFVVRANASDDHGLARVEVLLDEQLVAIIFAEPYDIYVASLGLAPGSYALRVRAVDEANLSRDAVITVEVPERTYRRLTLSEPGFKHMEPAWDPVGLQVAYSRQGVAPDATKNIYVIPSDATEGTGQRVTFGLQQDGNAVFSPDGGWIGFESNRTEYYQIYLTHFASGDTTALALTNIGASNQRRPTWISADAAESWVAYDSDRSGAALRDIYMKRISLEGDSITVVDPTGQPDRPADTNASDDLAPQWSAYGFLFANSTRNGSYAVTVLDPFLGGLARLVNGTTQFLLEEFAPALSPDDAYVAFSDTKTGTEKLYVVPTGGNGDFSFEIAPGTGAFPDSTGFPDAMDPAWDPTGRKIAFVSTRTGVEEIWILE